MNKEFDLSLLRKLILLYTCVNFSGFSEFVYFLTFPGKLKVFRFWRIRLLVDFSRKNSEFSVFENSEFIYFSAFPGKFWIITFQLFMSNLFIFWLFPEKFRVLSFWWICLLLVFSRKIPTFQFLEHMFILWIFFAKDFLENIERKQVVLSQKALKQREAKV